MFRSQGVGVMIPVLAKKPIPRLGSPFDGEVTATARALVKTLADHGYDLHDLAKMADAAPARRDRDLQESTYAKRGPGPPQRNRSKTLVGIWAREFVGDILDRSNLDLLSEKQIAVVNKLLRRSAAFRGEEFAA
jgi:hypothetical protein